MALPSQSFTDITPAHFDALMAEVERELSITLTGLSGTASNGSYTLSWAYDPTAETLVIQCLNKPWLVPGSMVQSKIKAFVEVSNV